MALSSTQPLAEMNNRNIFWKEREEKGDGCLWPIVSKCEDLNFLELSEPVIDMYRDCFNFATFFNLFLMISK
jgi:hypothetical protein